MNEHDRRLFLLAHNATQDLITPEEHVKRFIKGAIQRGNPLISDCDPYVVLGSDGFDGSWFPVGSFQTIEETMDCVKKKTDEEPMYSSDEEISSTFHPFTSDGIHLGHLLGGVE